MPRNTPRPGFAIRLFRCHECGHRMRLSGDICGWCHADKRDAIKPGFLGAAAALLAAAGLGVSLLLSLI